MDSMEGKGQYEKNGKHPNIELTYFVSGSNNGENFYHSGFYDIFPKGEENREKFRRENDADIVLVDNEYVRIVFTDFQYTNQYQSDDLSSMSFRYYAENKTDEPLKIAFYNFFFNDREEKTGDFRGFPFLHPTTLQPLSSRSYLQILSPSIS